MSILDDLFDDDVEAGVINVKKLEPEQWVVASTNQAVVQAMADGMSPESKDIDTTLPSPTYKTPGEINVAQTLRAYFDVYSLIIKDQLTPTGLRPTANDVVDGGIKNGSKVVLEIVGRNNYGKGSSWKEQIQDRIKGDSPVNFYFDKFSVSSFTEPDAERYQLHETFGAEVIQSFGRRPRMITMSGQIVNGKVDVRIYGESRSMDWKNAFQRYYDTHFSLKACLRKNKKVRIYAQDTIWYGYLLNMVAATGVETQASSQVTINFIVEKRHFVSQADENMPGLITPNGFRLSSATTPREFFPQERLEDAFASDFGSIVQDRISNLDLEFYEKVEEVSILAPEDNRTSEDNRGFFRQNARLLLIENSAEEVLTWKENQFINDIKFTKLSATTGLGDSARILEDLQFIDGGEIYADSIFLAKNGIKSRVEKVNTLCNRIVDIAHEILVLKDLT